MFKIVVIGGGISGMASAYLIQEALDEAGITHQLKLIEAENFLGGKVKTFSGEGFTCETGSNGFLDNKPLTLELVKKVNAEDMLLRSDAAAAKRFIYANGRLHMLSANPLRLFADDLLTISGRLRLLGEHFGAKRPEGVDETIADFARRRVGKNAFEMLIDPMVSGIYAGNPEKLSLKSCFARMYEMETEYGSLTNALIKLKKNKNKKKSGGGPSGPGGVLTTFKEGLSQLVERLAERIGRKKITDGHSVERVAPISTNGKAKYQVAFSSQGKLDPLEADVVIFATPAYATSRISTDLDKVFSETHAQIPYAKVNVVCLGFPKSEFKPDVDGFGFLIPGTENRKILGCLWTSSIFPGYRAPDDHVLLRAMIGGARRPELAELDDDAQIDIALSELGALMGVDTKPDFIKVFRHKWAIPQYNAGHSAKVEKIEGRLKDIPGVFVVGNTYKGIGFNDCVISANNAAAAVKKYLQELS